MFSGLAVLFCAGVVAQVFLAGLGLLVDPGYLAWHSTFVHLLEGLLVLLVGVGLAARAGARVLALTVGLYVLIAAQYAFIHALSGPFRALHAVNAFALFVVSWQIAKDAAHRGWSVASAGKPRGATGLDALLGAAVLLVAVASIAVPGTMNSDANAVLEVDRLTSVSTSSATDGAQVYTENCSGCHGERGGGRVGPALAGNSELADREFVVERISHGGGIMPPFEHSLSAAQIAAVADHVRASWGNGF